MNDFIIVGNGLAANVLAMQMYINGIKFKLIGNSTLSNSSLIAGGIWNPIVFKRMTKSWMADELIPELRSFYKHCEALTGTAFITERQIIKPFTSQEEKNFWLKKSEHDLKDYLENKLFNKDEFNSENILVPNQYGVVKQSGSINLKLFLEACNNFLTGKDLLLNESFDYSEMKISGNEIEYKNIKSNNIVFCEGHLVSKNPYFKWVPLNPVKGEVLEIKTDKLHFNNEILNKNGFIMRLSKDTFKAGATYEWKELDEMPSEKGLSELKNKISQITNAEYTITDHKAGVRPSSIDRRPIIGSHPKHKQLFVFNGLGTKGVMIAPYFAKNFVNFFLKKEALNKEADLVRFYNLCQE